MDFDENDFLKTERRKIPYSIFSLNPTRAIKHLLGHDAIIKSYVVNDIITDDECYIVDIEYYSIKFSPIKIFFVNASDIKPLIPDSSAYATQINGCNIKIQSSALKNYSKIVPITIQPSIPNNNSLYGQLDQQFSYFGLIVREPMHKLITPLRYPGHSFTPFKTEEVKPIYPTDYKYSPITIEETTRAYKLEVNQHSVLSLIDNIKVANTFEECKIGTTGYLIDINKIPTTNINGIILIQQKRIPSIVLFFPTTNFTICEEEMSSIKDFMKMDEVNAINYDYCMKVMNK